MRNVLASVFLVLYLVALIRPIAPLVEYYSNRDFFATVLCINKDKPELACKGQCILMQKLKKANTESSTPMPGAPGPKIDLKEYPIGFIAFANASFGAWPSIINQGCAHYAGQLSGPIEYEIFHPPSQPFVS